MTAVVLLLGLLAVLFLVGAVQGFQEGRRDRWASHRALRGAYAREGTEPPHYL